MSILFRGSRTRRLPSPLESSRAREQFELRRLCDAYEPIGAHGFAFSHVTAARLWGIPLPAPVERARELHVSVPNSIAPPRMRGVIGHRLGAAPTVLWAGLRLVTPVATWLQLAPTLTVDQLVVAGDFLVRRKRAWATLAEVQHAVATARGMPGIRTARMALCDIRPGTDSPPESQLRLILLRAGLPEPQIGYTLHLDGAFVGTPDLAYVAEKVAIEYEGEGHRLDPDTFANDIDRRERFEEAGWRVVRVTSRHLIAPRQLSERIRVILALRYS